MSEVASGARTHEGDGRLQYRMLGPIEVVRGDEVVDLGVLKQRALLALLLINANEVVSTDRIIDELWGDGAAPDREKALWVVVSRLRTALEPDRKKRSEGSILLSRPPGYVLSVDPDDVDAVRFEALATEGRALLETDPAAASLVFSEALGLWRGHALEEFMYEAFAEAEVSRLEELRLTSVEDRIDADLRCGRAAELVGELESLVRQHRARQRLVGHLMLALHLSGRQGDALRAFGTHRSYLAEELGLEPSAEISRLEERIVVDDPELREVGAVRALAGRPEPGLSVRGYELREQIGSGAMGNVYRAYQSSVGREVAIKVVRPELANDPSFIRHFEAEAQLIARLEHPQIVPIFDYWREPDSAYLVTRRFDGGSLRDLIESGESTAETAPRVVSQIGAALAAAHRQGVTHGDLKPENVLIDSDGNAYLADFGMSWTSGADGFVAPEQQASGEATPAADVYSLGRVAEYAFGTDHSQIAPVVAKATATGPGDRFDDVGAFLAALGASTGEPLDTEPVVAVNPYRGLHAFTEADADRFFGRERLIERLLSRLGHRGPQGRFVAVVGPSGSGKSSVVRAGVVPALRGAAVPGSERWFIVTVIPGRQPFEALEDALRAVAVDPPPNLLDKLVADGIAPTVAGLLPDPGAQIVLIIDQLEELFSLAPQPQADRFMEAVAAAATDRHSSVRVIATLRADFYDQPLRHRTFGELVRLGTEVITPMNPQELERAITGPAAAVGVSFEPGLVAMIASDMAGQATALPLLQYALTELFELRTDATITADAYDTLGGVSAALARRADRIHDALDAEDRRRVRDIFLRLVTVNEGGADTRRRALVSELTDAGGTDLAAVLDDFGRHRLLTFDRDAATRGQTVEIAHEALLTEWSRLHRWIDEARADIQAERQLAAAVDEWRDSGEESDFLLGGARLARYDGWSERPPVPLTADERAFLTASEAADAEELAMERRRVRRLRRLVIGVGAALVLALIAGGVAFQQQQRADDEAQRATDEATRAEAAAADAEAQTEVAVAAAEEAQLATLISRSAAAVRDDPELALLLALEAHERAPSADTERALLTSLGGATIVNRVVSRQRLEVDCPGFVASYFPPQLEGTVELALENGRAIGRDPLTGEMFDYGQIPGISGEDGGPRDCGLGWSNGTFGGAGTFSGRILVGAEYERELAVPGPTFPLFFSATRFAGRLFEEPVGLLYDARTGDEIASYAVEGHDGVVTFAVSEALGLVAFSFVKSLEVIGAVVVADLDTGEVLYRRLDMPRVPRLLRFDDERGHLIMGIGSGRLLTVDATSGEVFADIQTDFVTGFPEIGVRPDGTLVLVGRDRIQLADRVTGEFGPAYEITNVGEAHVRPDGLIVTVDQQGQIDLIDIDAGSPLVDARWDVDPLGHVSILDGRAVQLSRTGDLIETIDLATGERTRLDLRTPDGRVFDTTQVYPEPDGVWAVSKELVLARWQDGAMVESLALGSTEDLVWVPYGRKPIGVRFGDRYAVLGERADGTQEVMLVELRRGSARVMLRVPGPRSSTFESGIEWVHPTADGGVYVVHAGGSVVTHDERGDVVGVVNTGLRDTNHMTLDPTGRKLAIAGLERGEVVVIDTASGEVTRVAGRLGITSVMGFNGDGSLLGMVLFDGTVAVYDVDANSVPVVVWDGTGAFDSEPGWFDAESQSLWTNSSGKLIRISLDPAEWVTTACTIVGRDFTQEEWDRFVPGDEPLRSACTSS